MYEDRHLCTCGAIINSIVVEGLRDTWQLVTAPILTDARPSCFYCTNAHPCGRSWFGVNKHLVWKVLVQTAAPTTTDTWSERDPFERDDWLGTVSDSLGQRLRLPRVLLRSVLIFHFHRICAPRIFCGRQVLRRSGAESWAFLEGVRRIHANSMRPSCEAQKKKTWQFKCDMLL